MGWSGSGLAAAAGGLIGLFAGGAVGASFGGRREPGEGLIGRATGTVAGAGTGALVGVALGSFIGAAITQPSAAAAQGSTIVVNPNPPAPPVLPPAPPAPQGPPPPAPINDPLLTDTQSVFAARQLLGQWWQKVYTSSPQVVNNQLYTPVTTLTGGVLAADPNFVNALSFFQQWANTRPAAAFQATGLPVTQLPYTNGTLDTYTLQLLQWLSANPNA